MIFITWIFDDLNYLYYVDKKQKKRIDGKCVFCGEADYSLLDVHRIVPGSKYTKAGTVTVCSLCHRKCHSGRIKIVGKYFTSGGCYVVNCIIDDEELWLGC